MKELYYEAYGCDKFILKVHGCNQQEKDIVLINPSNKHSFINVNLSKRLQVSAKNIQITQVESENVQILKYLNITIDKYVLHSYFYAINMDVDVVLEYPWIDSIGIVNINVKKKFLKLWYKKNKITM
jgi:hypothetical protein